MDGDLYAYQESIGVEEVIHWENKPQLMTLHSDIGMAIASFNSLMIRLKRELEADKIIIALSDPNQRNWRVDMYPAYKAHRRRLGMRKPICYSSLLSVIAEQWDTVHFPRLEGDDVLGWLATNPNIEGEKIIVSVDKDMKTIPATSLYNTMKEELTPPQHVATADYYHMLQTLTGDTSDGYPGCPGVGKVTAPRILANASNMWTAVVQQYLKKEKTEADALLQAQLARILRFEDYNIHSGEIKLWAPVETERKVTI